MTVALSDRRNIAPARVTPAPRRRTRRVFPVGARFPRHTAAMELAYLAEWAENGSFTVTSTPVFPIGARFARCSPTQVQAYVAEQALISPATTQSPRAFPVGARFPRRPTS